MQREPEIRVTAADHVPWINKSTQFEKAVVEPRAPANEVNMSVPSLEKAAVSTFSRLSPDLETRNDWDRFKDATDVAELAGTSTDIWASPEIAQGRVGSEVPVNSANLAGIVNEKDSTLIEVGQMFPGMATVDNQLSTVKHHTDISALVAGLLR